MSSSEDGGISVAVKDIIDEGCVVRTLLPSTLEQGASDTTEPPTPSKVSKRRAAAKKALKSKLDLAYRLRPRTSDRPSKMTDNTTELGALAHRGHNFCPYAAVAKYPYKYIDRVYLHPVSNNYFAGGLLRARGWTLYYIHTYGASPKPLILVPAVEVEAFIYDINKELGISLKFPRPSHEPGFVLNFDEQGSPRPRYLGRINEEIGVEEMELKILPPDYRAAGETEEPEDRSFEAFKAKIEAANQAGKNKSKSQKERRKKDRVLQKQAWCAQLKRVQCYLGVRPRRSDVRNLLQSPTDPNLSWDQYLEAQRAYDLARCVNLPPLDVKSRVPYGFSQSVVFVCVDIEVWEKDHSTTTEVGISTLDTEDLRSLPPGEDGKAWMTAIRPRHFRVLEYLHHANSEYVTGCAERFEKDFGASEFVSIKDVPKVIGSCFKPPFSAHYQMQSHKGPLEMDSKPTLADGEARRNIVLVGHDIKSDIEFMRNVGYDVSSLSNVLEAIDTADMFKALKQEHQASSLGKVLLDLGMTGWNLHNAGNDAAYTLQAMIAIAFSGLRDKHARQAATAAERARKLEAAADDARDRVKEEGEEWEIADVDEGDGGVPVAIEPKPRPAPTGFGLQGVTARLPKMNSAARTRAAQREAKAAQMKEEASWTAKKPGVHYFAQPGLAENIKPIVPEAEVVCEEATSKPAFSIDDLDQKIKAKLAIFDTEDEGDGGVEL